MGATVDFSSLITDIERAFAEVDYPGDLNLIGGKPPDPPFDDMYRVLVQKTWKDVQYSEFIGCDTPFGDLTDTAFHYYMPGLLTASLSDDIYENSDIAGALVSICHTICRIQPHEKTIPVKQNFRTACNRSITLKDL